jgi:hypothetical protein
MPHLIGKTPGSDPKGNHGISNVALSFLFRTLRTVFRTSLGNVASLYLT